MVPAKHTCDDDGSATVHVVPAELQHAHVAATFSPLPMHFGSRCVTPLIVPQTSPTDI